MCSLLLYCTYDFALRFAPFIFPWAFSDETPNAYITKRKLEKAELSLVTTAMPVKSIADILGYDDYSYFNRLFKKYAGVTPQKYRELHFE